MEKYIKQIIFNQDIFFEFQLLDMLLKKKIIKFQDVKFYENEYKNIKVKNIKLIRKNKNHIFDNRKYFFKIHEPNAYTIEPVFIKNPNILELYYKEKKIKFEYVDDMDSLQEVEDLKEYELYEMLKIKLQNSKDVLEI